SSRMYSAARSGADASTTTLASGEYAYGPIPSFICVAASEVLELTGALRASGAGSGSASVGASKLQPGPPSARPAARINLAPLDNRFMTMFASSISHRAGNGGVADHGRATRPCNPGEPWPV